MTTNQVTIRDGRTAAERDRAFLPGMGKTWLLPAYDAFSGVAGVRRLHDRAAARAAAGAGESVLDVGCGTGNLSFALLRRQPGLRVTGLDPDGDALRRAARKARRRGVPIDLVQGYADRLPAADASVDHVVSALALHHIDDDQRSAFAADASRVLRPGGRVTVLDFDGSGSHGAASRQHRHGPLAQLRRRARASRQVRPNTGGGIVALLADAGFDDVREVEHLSHRVGEVTIVQARRP